MTSRRLPSALILLLLAVGASSLPAQQAPLPTDSQPKFKPYRRVPRYFAQVGLSATQRELIYDIRGRHKQQIDALEQQIALLRAQELAACESVLTPAQRRLLALIRDGSRSRKSPSATNPQALTP